MLLFRSQRTSKTSEFVKNNEPTSAFGTPGDMWKRFLGNNGGTGDTFYDLEMGSKATSKDYMGSFPRFIRDIRRGDT